MRQNGDRFARKREADSSRVRFHANPRSVRICSRDDDEGMRHRIDEVIAFRFRVSASLEWPLKRHKRKTRLEKIPNDRMWSVKCEDLERFMHIICFCESAHKTFSIRNL